MGGGVGGRGRGDLTQRDSRRDAHGAETPDCKREAWSVTSAKHARSIYGYTNMILIFKYTITIRHEDYEITTSTTFTSTNI